MSLITNQLYAVSIAKSLAILLEIAEIVNVATTAEKLILKTLTVQKTQPVLTVISKATLQHQEMSHLYKTKGSAAT